MLRIKYSSVIIVFFRTISLSLIPIPPHSKAAFFLHIYRPTASPSSFSSSSSPCFFFSGLSAMFRLRSCICCCTDHHKGLLWVSTPWLHLFSRAGWNNPTALKLIIIFFLFLFVHVRVTSTPPRPRWSRDYRLSCEDFAGEPTVTGATKRSIRSSRTSQPAFSRRDTRLRERALDTGTRTEFL